MELVESENSELVFLVIFKKYPPQREIYDGTQICIVANNFRSIIYHTWKLHCWIKLRNENRYFIDEKT